MPHLARSITLLVSAGLLLSACGVIDESSAAEETTVEGFPLTVQNCGVDVTFDAPPERVMLLNSAPVTSLQAIGVMDKVVSRAGPFPDAYYDDATKDALAGVASLTEETNDSGHLQISQEVILDQEPDLVMGLPDGITRDALSSVGIPVLEQPAFCPEGLPTPSFEDVYAEMQEYGTIFDREEQADTAVAGLRERVEAIEVPENDRTAAVLFPTAGGGSVSAYGTASMADPQLKAAGFTNVFGDSDERVFEITTEELIDRDPDVLILLHSDGEPGPIKDAVTSLPGAGGLKAVRNDDIMVQLFNFTEPPTPLALDGLERIDARFSSGSAETVPDQ